MIILMIFTLVAGLSLAPSNDKTIKPKQTDFREGAGGK